MTTELLGSGESFLLDSLKRYKVKDVEYSKGSPKEPPKHTSAYLDHLEKYAVELQLAHPGAPRIVRKGQRFIFQRQEKKQTRYKSIRSILKKLAFELSLVE